MTIDFKEIFNKVLSKKGNAFFFTPAIYEKARSYLLVNPADVVTLTDTGNIDLFFYKQNEMINKGMLAFACFNYEFGYQVEEKLSSLVKNDENVTAEMIFFSPDNVHEYESDSIEFHSSYLEEYSVRNFNINVSKRDYYKKVEQVKDFISKGDTYQVNYTVNSVFQLNGSLFGLITSLLFNQAAKYIAIINNFPELIISISPELFFEYINPVLIARPMKGTISRGVSPADDHKNYMSLSHSSKDKAENIMIVDLLRNDMGKISDVDSVRVERLYEIEKYESVYQLTSTIKSRAEKLELGEIIKNLFPCGSVTGAPKIRTMEIINELETYKRGIYTGAIGLLTNEKMTFNVPIRTLEINLENKEGRLPIGSGIVWDSEAKTEFNEIKSKAGFLINPDPYFEIIESMLVENNRVFLWEYHIKRIRNAAEFFLFKFVPGNFENVITNLVSDLNPEKKYKLRVLLDKWGTLKTDLAEIAEHQSVIKVKISSRRINENNKFIYFKTTNRNMYNSEYNQAEKEGFFDVLFLNSKDEVTEGTRCNVIVRSGDKLITPPVSAGILNGCYRQYLLDKGEITESSMRLSDLFDADEIFLCNSVRGMVKIDSVQSEN